MTGGDSSSSSPRAAVVANADDEPPPPWEKQKPPPPAAAAAEEEDVDPRFNEYDPKTGEIINIRFFFNSRLDLDEECELARFPPSSLHVDPYVGHEIVALPAGEICGLAQLSQPPIENLQPANQVWCSAS